jgi:hypothetical protein
MTHFSIRRPVDEVAIQARPFRENPENFLVAIGRAH